MTAIFEGCHEQQHGTRGGGIFGNLSAVNEGFKEELRGGT